MNSETREYIELVAERTAEKTIQKAIERLPCTAIEERVRDLETKTVSIKGIWWALAALFTGLINTAFWAFRK